MMNPETKTFDELTERQFEQLRSSPDYHRSGIFTIGEEIPLRGYRWKVVGLKDGKITLEVVEQTARSKKDGTSVHDDARDKAMTNRTKRLELTWIGKEERPRLEPRILLEDQELSYAKRVSEDDIFDNRLIHGDNLLALKALEQEFAGKVKCIYIDPPYNTGSAFEQYDDGVEHSIWLSLIRDRLELLAKLLRDDGSIWISIDDNEAHYLKVLCDEVFGRANFVANMIWEKRTTRENRRVFSFNHDHVLVYAKVKSAFEAVRNPLPLNQTVLDRYKNPDNDPRGPWQSVSANAQAGHATASQFYDLIAPSGVKHRPPEGRCWLYTEERLRAEIAKNNIWFGKDGKSAPRIKKFLRDAQADDAGLTPETLWKSDEVGTNGSAKKHLLQVFDGESRFDTPKPEELIARIVEIASNAGDLVLDSFLGSGTTAAVAHKLGRRWIGIELGEHATTCCLPRLKRIVEGNEPGGITTHARWQGGGGFRFFKLAPSLLEKDHVVGVRVTPPASIYMGRRLHSKDRAVQEEGEGQAVTTTVFKSLIIQGDCLDVLPRLQPAFCRLAYIDPPFNTGSTQKRDRVQVTVAAGEGDRTGFGGKRFDTEKVASSSYVDTFEDFEAFLMPRIKAALRCLTPDGSLFVHLDYREVHYIKVALDRLLGRDHFMNEIIWAFDYGGRSKKKWSTKHNTILWYVMDPAKYVFNYDQIDRVPYMAPGLVSVDKAALGKHPTATWWHTIVPTNGKEKTGYPTQKPLGVLNRIVKVHSNPGDTVLDFFAGSGTTGMAAAMNGREFILIDILETATQVATKRLKQYPHSYYKQSEV